VQNSRRFHSLLVTLGLAAAAVGATTALTLSHYKPVDQCSLPLSQRTGGWTCYQPANPSTTPQRQNRLRTHPEAR